VGNIELKSLTHGNVGIDGDKATLGVVVEVSAADAKTGKPAEGFGRVNRTLSMVKESGAWKVWCYLSSEEDLAARMGAAKTDEERKALLEENHKFVSPELDKALIAGGKRLQGLGALLSGMSKAEALRRAELKLLKSRRFSDPFYWAPFVVVGNGR
jgi:hypothetical protein